ncbi:MAG: hypothetical protein KJO98_04280 [Rhodothermia bacterium]|nr:hypothetical protein [Rhodothermia bacterium]
MNLRKNLQTLAMVGVLAVSPVFVTACSDPLVADDGQEVTFEAAEIKQGKQLERYFRLPPPPPGEEEGGNSTASDSTAVK